MSTIVPTISGPKRPQDKVLLTDASQNFIKVLKQATKKTKISTLRTYVDLRIKERKEYLEGDTAAMRAQSKLQKPKSMEGRRVKSPPVKTIRRVKGFGLFNPLLINCSPFRAKSEKIKFIEEMFKKRFVTLSSSHRLSS